VLQRNAARRLGRGPSDPLAIDELADRAARRDAASLAAFADYGRAVAGGLGTLLALYGRTSCARWQRRPHFPLYREAIDIALAELRTWTGPVDVVATKLDDYGGAIGAARLATAGDAGGPARP